MASFQSLIRHLRRAEQQLAKQLAGIRRAISSLEFGSAASPGIRVESVGPKRSRVVKKTGRRRKVSAKARAAMSRAQKKRWAKHRSEVE